MEVDKVMMNRFMMCCGKDNLDDVWHDGQCIDYKVKRYVCRGDLIRSTTEVEGRHSCQFKRGEIYMP